MVEAVGDPLRYSDDELIEEISRLLRVAVGRSQGEGR